jgi:hypothetical protein
MGAIQTEMTPIEASLDSQNGDCLMGRWQILPPSGQKKYRRIGIWIGRLDLPVATTSPEALTDIGGADTDHVPLLKSALAWPPKCNPTPTWRATMARPVLRALRLR